jgi:hypothetical protein
LQSQWQLEEDGESYLGENEVLPNQVRLAYGLKTAHGRYGGIHKLIDDNDNHFTFKEIADTIEKALNNPEMGMFV